ncbi:MAG: hypothetical protein ACTTH7_03655 [Treponema sp.]
MAHNKNYTLKEWLEEPLYEDTFLKKSWFLNGNLPGEDYYHESEKNGTVYSELYWDSLSDTRNILQGTSKNFRF